MLQVISKIGGDSSGFYPSILVTGLSEADAVSMTGEGKTYAPTWITKEVIQQHTQLEYIQSSGTQFIDTGISGGTNASYEIVFAPVSSNTAWQMYFAGTATPTVPKLFANNTSCTSLYVEGNSGSQTVSISSSSKNTVKYNSYGSVEVNGTSIDSSTIGSARLGWGSMAWQIFNSPEETTLYSNMKLYSLKMWTNGVLVRDFVPAKRNSDAVIGLYDFVSHTFFTNAGTGTFTAGSETGQIEEVVTTKYWLFDKIKKLGTYEITASDGINTNTETVLIDVPIEYEIEMSLG